MRAIVLAAQEEESTGGQPLCMRPLADKSCLQHQIDCLHAYGVDRITVCRGDGSRQIAPNRVRFSDAPHGKPANLLSARADLVGDVLVSYSNVIYHPAILEAVLSSYMSCTLVVDRAWKRSYEARNRSFDKAPLVRVASNGQVLDIGCGLDPNSTFGEFIGLARFSSGFVSRLWSFYETKRMQHAKINGVFPEEATLYDLLNASIVEGERIAVLAVEGAWREVAVEADLARAEPVVDRWFSTLA